MAKMVKSYCKCEHCIHGNKELDSKNRTCGPCLKGEKRNFKKRAQPWPIHFPAIPGLRFE